jgi:hypothetical protein
MDESLFRQIAEQIKPPIEIIDAKKYTKDTIKEYLADTGIDVAQLKAPSRFVLVFRFFRDLPINIWRRLNGK